MTTEKNNIYYDPEKGYGGLQDFIRKYNAENKKKITRKEALNFLQQQDTYTLHRPVITKFKTRRVFVRGIDDQFQADLVDLISIKGVNKNYKYILTIIDCFSKYAWAVALKTKTAAEVTTAFERVFKTSKRIPAYLQSDNGLEFTNKMFQTMLQKHNVTWFATQSEKKSSIVERFNRTLKDNMFRYFTGNNTKTWIRILPKLLKNYNTTYHRSIRMTPTQASNVNNENEVRDNLYGDLTKIKKSAFAVGNLVRITRKDNLFRKGYMPGYTKETFKITKQLRTNPITYQLTDLNDEEILGGFYEQEMTRVIQ